MPHNHMGCMSPRDYFTEQLLTILVCGGLGFVGVEMYRQDMLRHILAPQFHLPVLVGSIGVLVLVAFRAVAVWKEAGTLQPVDEMGCQQNHTHTAACNHTLPGLPGLPPGDAPDETMVDDHGHSHDMSWVFARMLILVFPIALFALGIPNSGFSQDFARKQLKDEKAFNLDPKELETMAKDPATTTLETKSEEGATVRILQTASGLKIRAVTASGSEEVKYSVVAEGGVEMRFNDINDAAADPDKRKSYTGQTAILEGKFNRLSDKEFTLFRLKMTCCGADAVPLKVRIVAPQALSGFNEGEWVKVTGVIRFIQAGGAKRYTPVLMITDIGKDIQRGIKPRNEYEI